jgi:hypothetical protein
LPPHRSTTQEQYKGNQNGRFYRSGISEAPGRKCLYKKQLQQSGFEMRELSIVGEDCHANEQVVGFYNAGDWMKS